MCVTLGKYVCVLHSVSMYVCCTRWVYMSDVWHIHMNDVWCKHTHAHDTTSMSIIGDVVNSVSTYVCSAVWIQVLDHDELRKDIPMVTSTDTYSSQHASRLYVARRQHGNCACVHAYIYIYIYIHIHTYIHTHTHIHAHWHIVHMRTRMWTRMHVHMCK